MSKLSLLNVNLPLAIVTGAVYGSILSSNMPSRNSYQELDLKRRISTLESENKALERKNKELKKQLDVAKEFSYAQKLELEREVLNKSVEAKVNKLLGTEQKSSFDKLFYIKRDENQSDFLKDLNEAKEARLKECREHMQEYFDHPTQTKGKEIIFSCSCASLNINKELQDIIAISSHDHPLTPNNEALFLGALQRCYDSPNVGDGGDVDVW